MAKKFLGTLVFAGLLSGVTLAQNTRQPANLTIDPTKTPEVLQLLNKSGGWTPTNSIESTNLSLPYNANGIDVRSVGMVGDGVTDNSQFVPALLALTLQGQSSQSDIIFPHIPGQY